MINFNKFINEASKNELRVSLRHAPEAIDAYNDGRWSKMSKMKGSDVYVFKKEDDMLDFYDTLTSDWDIPEEEITMNESKIQLKRKYTEKYPAITAGKSARVRNKMLEAIADGKITQEEFDSILKEYSRDSSRWMRRNSKYFNVSEEGISLSKFGKRAFDSIKINEEDPVEEGRKFIAAAKKAKDAGKEEFEFEGKTFPVTIKEGNAFGAARAKAIADGKKEFTVDGETYPVEDVDKEDKENAEDFKGESVVTESMELKKLEDAIKMFQDKIAKQGRVTNARDEEHLENLIRIYKEMGGKNIKESTSNEATSESFIIESFSKFVESLNESEMLNEAFKSMKLAKLLTPKKKSSWDKGIAQEFYNYTKVKLDKIEDHDLLEVDPKVAYKQKGGTKVKFFLIDNEKMSPYTEDSYDGRIPAGLIAVLDGNNDFMGSVYKRFSSNKGRVLTKTNKSDSLGVNKKRKGYGATGLSSAKRIAEFADRAIVIDIDILKQRYSALQQIDSRDAAKKGAIAFKSDKDFKAENLARYNEILANKASALPLDKMVKDAIDKIANQIKEGLAKGEKGRYGDIIVGKNSKGREAKMKDASNHMGTILDDYSRYVQYVADAEKEKAEWGKENSYYAREAKNYAKNLRDRIKQIDNFGYAW